MQHFFLTYYKIESQILNEYWVSYYILDQIFDKKFIFTEGSMDPSNMTYIPELDMEGVLHG